MSEFCLIGFRMGITLFSGRMQHVGICPSHTCTQTSEGIVRTPTSCMYSTVKSIFPLPSVVTKSEYNMQFLNDEDFILFIHNTVPTHC